MKLSAYYALQHSYKGTTWKSHKYLYKKDGRYYYREVDYDKKTQGSAVEISEDEAVDLAENDPNADNEITDVNEVKAEIAKERSTTKTKLEQLKDAFDAIGKDEGSKQDRINEKTKRDRIDQGLEDHPLKKNK